MTKRFECIEMYWDYGELEWFIPASFDTEEEAAKYCSDNDSPDKVTLYYRDKLND